MVSLQMVVLAFSLSGDAFAAALAKGARHPDLPFHRSLLIALAFGVLEALAPLLGWLAGRELAGVIGDIDHWIAFALLGVLGARMVWRGLHAQEEADQLAHPTWFAVAATAVGTSIDATVVGVTLALVGGHMAMTVATIGFVTFGMTLLGLRIGRLAGLRIGRAAELLGGLGLIAIGSSILLQHLAA